MERGFSGAENNRGILRRSGCKIVVERRRVKVYKIVDSDDGGWKNDDQEAGWPQKLQKGRRVCEVQGVKRGEGRGYSGDTGT